MKKNLHIMAMANVDRNTEKPEKGVPQISGPEIPSKPQHQPEIPPRKVDIKTPNAPG